MSKHGDIPGESKPVSTSLVETAVGALQTVSPIRQIGLHFCAFHYYAHDMSRQIEAHHYCSCVNEDFQQCLVYDSDNANARLIGVEFIISDKLFATLPEEEKKLWHSHVFEVKSGILFMPNVPAAAEDSHMKRLVRSYGKTIHLWQVDRGDTLPLGVPQIMGSFTSDGQIYPQLVKDAEERYGVTITRKKEHRRKLEGPPGGIDPAVDRWVTTGQGLRTELQEVPMKLPTPGTPKPLPAAPAAQVTASPRTGA